MRNTYMYTHKARLCHHIWKTYVHAGQSVNIEIRKTSSDSRTFLKFFYSNGHYSIFLRVCLIELV